MSEHHMTGRRNAAKPESKKSTANIQMRCHPDDKALIVRNLKKGETIASFMLSLATEEAMARESKYLENKPLENKPPSVWMLDLPQRQQQALIRAEIMEFEDFEKRYLEEGESFLLSLPNIGYNAAKAYMEWFDNLNNTSPTPSI